jgi:hypothetical protein
VSPTGPEDEESSSGRLGPTGPGPLAVYGGIGLVVGWTLHWVTLHSGRTEPQVTLASVFIVFFLAALVGWAAYSTEHARREGIRLPPHRAVNRLVLGKTCSLVGALIAGGYFGFALAHVHAAGADSAFTQLWHSVIGGIGGLALMTAALLLEQACRVPPADH